MDEGDKYQDWAAFQVPVTIQAMYPNDLDAAQAAYEAYLGLTGGEKGGQERHRERGEEPEFANYARVELGKIHMTRGNMDQARALFEYALTNEEHHEVREMAQEQLRRLNAQLAREAAAAAKAENTKVEKKPTETP